MIELDDEIYTKLVLSHTVFHNAFRADKFRNVSQMNALKQFLRARFISDFIIEMGSESPEGECCGVTSQRIFSEFSTKLEAEGTFLGKDAYFQILKSFIFCVPDESINKLDVNEGIIVIADALSNRGNYEPIIITDMKKTKMKSTATEYYKKYTGQDEPKMPFQILNAKEAINFLHGRFQKYYDLVKQRDSKYNII